MNKYSISQFIDSYIHHKSIAKDIEMLIGKNDTNEILAEYGKVTIDTILSDSDKLKNEMETKLKEMYEDFIKRYDGRSSQQVIENVKTQLLNKEFCFQGGLGHRIGTSAFDLPHHWCIKPEFYKTVKPTDYEILVFKMRDYSLNSNESPAYEQWGN